MISSRNYSFSPQALEAANLIDRLARLVRLEPRFADLNAAQWETLRYLARANRFSRTPAALAYYLASTRGTISRTLSSLERKHYVRRKPSARDNRSVELALTKKALSALRHDPLYRLAQAIEQASGRNLPVLLDNLRQTLRVTIQHNRGRAFGACATCRYFRKNVRPGTATPHHCGLLDEPLSEADSHAICVEQEPRAA